VIPWRGGRSDVPKEQANTAQVPANGRLPDAVRGNAHIRCVFSRMGFNDRDLVGKSFIRLSNT
jgi:cytochrome c peroxidase